MKLNRISSETKNQIRLLRQKGHSLPEISRALGVSRTSVLRHIKGVEILPEHLSEWAGKRGGSRRIRLRKEALAFNEGKELVGKLSLKEKLLIVSALYWAEGTKGDFSLSNTDPKLIKVFVECMRELFHLKNDQIFINVRIYEDLDKDKCLSYWSSVVRVPKEHLRGVNVLAGKKRGKLEYGMCRVRIAKGGDILKKIKGIYAAVFNQFVPIAQ